MKKITAYDISDSSLRTIVLVPMWEGYFYFRSGMDEEDIFSFIPGNVIKAINEIENKE